VTGKVVTATVITVIAIDNTVTIITGTAPAFVTPAVF